MMLDACTEIVDEKKFIEAHTATIERNGDNHYFCEYVNRLKKYKELSENAHKHTNESD